MTSKLNIRRFDPSTIAPDAVVLLVGKRGTGKSTLLKDLMYHMRHKLDFGLAMSPTEECTNDLGSYLPPSCIYSDFAGDKVDALLEEQRKAIKRGSGRRVFLLLDDCMYDKKILRGINVRNLFMNGRHRHIFFINCQQYVMDMPPDLRSQVDYVFVMRDNIRANKEKLWKFFFGVFPSFADFNTVMDNCTQNFECLVYNGKKSSTNLEECVFWYKAEHKLPPFTLCRPVYSALHKRFYRDREDEEPADPTARTIIGSTRPCARPPTLLVEKST
jgi:energy-coupling factor transporter ATP-binding protein EcfA2